MSRLFQRLEVLKLFKEKGCQDLFTWAGIGIFLWLYFQKYMQCINGGTEIEI